MDPDLPEIIGYVSASDVEYIEARLQKGWTTGYTLKNGEQEPIKYSFDYGLNVRLIVDGSLGFASTNVLDKRNIQKTLDIAYKIARSCRGFSKKVVLSSEKLAKTRWTVDEKNRIDDISIEDRLKLLYDIDHEMTPDNVKINLPTRLISLSIRQEDKRYFNSEGVSVESTIPRISLFSLLLAAEKGKGSIQRTIHLGGSGGWEIVKEWKPASRFVREAKTLGEILRRGEGPPKGEIDLVVGPEVTGIICHEACGHPLEADRILGREAAQAGKSFVDEGMLGFKIGSEDVTILDDPTIPNSYGYYLYDDEGVKARSRVLIDKGRIRDFLHNRETANILDVKSNSAARASSYDKEPIIRMANTYLKSGDQTVQELIEDIDRGVYMKTFMEWNIDDRRFHQRYVGLEAYLIEHGRIGTPIKNPIIELTTPGLYGSVDGVGDDLEFGAAICGKGDPLQPIPVWHGGPSIRLRNIRLGG